MRVGAGDADDACVCVSCFLCWNVNDACLSCDAYYASLCECDAYDAGDAHDARVCAYGACLCV